MNQSNTQSASLYIIKIKIICNNLSASSTTGLLAPRRMTIVQASSFVRPVNLITVSSPIITTSIDLN